jgi:hypothetical protein
VVHVREKKTRLSEVDHDESIGRARKGASGRVRGVRRVEREGKIIVVRVWR